MGSFSWMRADQTTQRANISNGDKYKILIPKEFGGGYIKDTYYDYGYINYSTRKAVYVDENGKQTTLTETGDIYGMLAYMNIESLQATLDNIHILTILEKGNTTDRCIRSMGISTMSHDSTCDFPPKLVSYSYGKTYEQCKAYSLTDPDQGFTKKKWNSKVNGFGTYGDLYEKLLQNA